MKRVLMAVFAAVLAPVFASAQEGSGVQGRWSVTFSGGAALPAGGEFHEGGRGTVLGLPTTVDAKKTTDVFDPGVGWRGGVGYGLSRRAEIFGDFAWKRAEASELSVGRVADFDLRAAFGDYTSYGLDGGVRVHMRPDSTVNPYIAGVAGFRRIEAIPGTFRVPAANVTLPDVPFFAESTVPVVGGDAGVLFAISQRVSLGVEAGVRYHGDLTENEGLAGTGLENLNDAGDRWSVPMSGVVRFGF